MSASLQQGEVLAEDASAERLLFMQYRFWMAGYTMHDINCWEIAWISIAKAAGAEAAALLYGPFHGFVRTLLEQARRDLGWRPAACCRLCLDEQCVLDLVTASQHGRVAEEERSAEILLGHSSAGDLLEASRTLGRALAAQGFSLGQGGVASALFRSTGVPVLH